MLAHENVCSQLEIADQHYGGLMLKAHRAFVMPVHEHVSSQLEVADKHYGGLMLEACGAVLGAD